MRAFRNFLTEENRGRNLYGFRQPEPAKRTQDDDDALPIKAFGVERLLDSLASEEFRGNVGRVAYSQSVVWGSGSGSVRVKINPNLGVTIERQVDDRQGGVFWACHRAFRIREEYAGREDTVASDLAGEVKSIVSEPLDSAKPEFAIRRLVHRVEELVKNMSESSAFVYQSTHKHNDDWYTMLFSLKGAGVGQLVRQTKGGETPAGIIELAFYPKEGRVKGIITTVGIEGESEAWKIMVPYFMADFAPSQSVGEIAGILQTGIRTI